MRERVACILLAAGGSSRLGSPKQLIDIDGEPLIVRSARILLSLDVGPVGVVTGSRSDAIQAAINKLPVVVLWNPQWESGIGTSIRRGVDWAAEMNVGSMLVTLCDQPEVDASHLMQLIEIAEADCVATAYDRTLGVPAMFRRSLFERLRSLPPGEGAKSIFRDMSLRVSKVRCEAAKIDLDTHEAIAQWRASRSASGEPRRTSFSP